MKLFNFDIHIGRWRVLVQTRDIAERAITAGKIAERAIQWFHIALRAIRNEHIDDQAVDTRTLADEAVTPEKLSRRVVTEVVEPLLDGQLDDLRERDEQLAARDADLQHQIESLVMGSEVPISNSFGDSEWVCLSQRFLSHQFRRVWQKISMMTGEDFSEGLYELRLECMPSYFIGDKGCNVNITATMLDGTEAQFDHIAFYIDGKLVVQEDNTPLLEYVTEIDKTSVVKCVATILGETYTQQRTIKHYSPFWLGSGNSYCDVMKGKNLVTDKATRFAHDVIVAEGEHIIIVIAEFMRDALIRADINGIEIAFDETKVAVAGEDYCVLTSKNTFSAGTYNVDING